MTVNLDCLLDRAPRDRDWKQWRDAEEDLFVLVELLRRGRLPDPAAMRTLPRSGLRRLGYLVDVVLLHLAPEYPSALKELVEMLQRAVPAATLPVSEAVPAVPWPVRRSPFTTYDDVGRRWGVAPGIDLARWRAEIEALRVVRPELH